jgi:hypothetical protein
MRAGSLAHLEFDGLSNRQKRKLSARGAEGIRDSRDALQAKRRGALSSFQYL